MPLCPAFFFFIFLCITEESRVLCRGDRKCTLLGWAACHDPLMLALASRSVTVEGRPFWLALVVVKLLVFCAIARWILIAQCN